MLAATTQWNYLRFDKYGDLKKGCPLPADGQYVWGFCGEDHRVYLCIKQHGYGLAFVNPYHGIEDDLYVIAWAPIEAPTAPDLNAMRAAKTLKAPIYSLEAWRDRLSFAQRSHRKAGPAKSKAEQSRRDKLIKELKARIEEEAANCVLEDGFHLPPVEARKGKRRYDWAISTRTP